MDPAPTHRARLFVRAVFSGALLLAVVGCQPQPRGASPQASGALVVAGDGVLCDLTRRLAPQEIEVACLLGAGEDPHHFRLTPSQSQILARARLLLVNGGGLTPALEKLPQRVAILDALPASADRQDPHLWHDPALAALMVQQVAAQLVSVAPAQRQAIETRATALQTALADLDRWNRLQLATISAGPDGQRPPLALAHRALGAFSAAYGLRELPLVDRDSNSASLRPAAFASVVAELHQNQVPSLFREPGPPARSLQRISLLSGVPIAPTPLVVDGLAMGGEGQSLSLMATLVANTCAIAEGLKGRCDRPSGERLVRQWQAVGAAPAPSIQ